MRIIIFDISFNFFQFAPSQFFSQYLQYISVFTIRILWNFVHLKSNTSLSHNNIVDSKIS